MRPSRRWAPFAAALATIACLLSSGCLEFPAEQPCLADADCRDGKVCRVELCVPPGPREGRDAAILDAGAPPDARPVSDAAAPEGPCGPLDRDEAPACAQCLRRTGTTCDALRACGEDSICAAQATCARACDDPRCVADCAATPGAEILGLRLHTNAFRACSAACDLGQSWGCVNAFDWGGAASQRLSVQLAILRVPASVAYPGAVVRACAELDTRCERPLAETVSADDGLASFELDLGMDPVGFTGYFAIMDDTLMPTVAVPAARIVQHGAFLQPVVSATDAVLTIRLATGHDPTPGRATVLAQVRDCHGFPAPDIVIEITDGTEPQPGVYFSGNFPDRALDATDGSGLAGFIDVPVTGDGATITLTAHRKDDPTVLAHRQVLVRPDLFTFVFLGPDSRD